MSFLKNVITQIKGVLNDAQESSEDIGSVARQTVREIEADIGNLEEALVGIEAEHLILLTKITKADEDVTKYTNYAQKAVKAGNDTLALEAINDKNSALTERELLQKQADKFAPSVQTVKERLAALNLRKEQMARDASLLEGRAAVAEAQDRVATVLGGIGNGSSASESFERMEERLEKNEARAQAKMNLAAAKDGSENESKYAELDDTSATSAADELAAMKSAAGK